MAHGFQPCPQFLGYNSLAKGMPIRMPIRINQRRPLIFGVAPSRCRWRCVAHLLLRSQCTLVRTMSDTRSWEVCCKLWLHHLQGFSVPTLASHLRCFVIADLDEPAPCSEPSNRIGHPTPWGPLRCTFQYNGIESHLFRVLLQRRLRRRLPLSSRFCWCGFDVFGHYRAACSRTGELGRRGPSWLSTQLWSLPCRDGTAREGSQWRGHQVGTPTQGEDLP